MTDFFAAVGPLLSKLKVLRPALMSCCGEPWARSYGDGDGRNGTEVGCKAFGK